MTLITPPAEWELLIKLGYNQTDVTHLFCYVTWKQRHPMSNWFEKSAVVSSTLNEVEGGCCFVPIQRLL